MAFARSGNRELIARGYGIATILIGALALSCVAWGSAVPILDSGGEIEPQLGISLLGSGAILATIAMCTLRRGVTRPAIRDVGRVTSNLGRHICLC